MRTDDHRSELNEYLRRAADQHTREVEDIRRRERDEAEAYETRQAVIALGLLLLFVGAVVAVWAWRLWNQ